MAEISYISAQMTITDLTDGTTLITRMGDNKNNGGVFYYDDNKAAGSQYTPSWPSASSNGEALVLTPIIHTTTANSNLFNSSHVPVASVKYLERHPSHSGGFKEIPAVGVTGLFEFVGGDKYKIQLGNRWENSAEGWPKLTGNQIVYEVQFKYKDPIFASADAAFQGIDMSIQYVVTRFESGDGATYITILATPGDTFVNAASNATIELKALVTDKGTPVTTFTDANSKWEYFDDTEGVFKPVNNGVSSTEKNILTISQDMVDGSEIFKFKWTPDTGTTWFEAVKTVVDYSDPYVVSMNSLNGDIFKEGQGTDKTIAVRIYKTQPDGSPKELLGSTELAPFTAEIRRYDKTGAEIKPTEQTGAWKTIIGSSAALGKSLEFVVTPDDVTVYCTFIASVKYQKPAAIRSFK